MNIVSNFAFIQFIDDNVFVLIFFVIVVFVDSDLFKILQPSEVIS